MAVNPLVVGNIVQTVIYSKVNDQQCLNVLHWRVKEVTTPKPYFEQLDDILDAVGDPTEPTITRYMTQAMSVTAKVVWVQAQCVGPDRRPFARYAVDTDGEDADPCSAQNVAAVITKQVERPGRGASGSFHLPGLPTSAYAFGDLEPAFVVKLLNIAERLAMDVQPDDESIKLEPVTFNPEGVGALMYNRVINAFPQTTLRVMRRRTVGLGI